MTKYELEMMYRLPPFNLPRKAASRRASREARDRYQRLENYYPLTYNDPTGELAVSRVLSS